MVAATADPDHSWLFSWSDHSGSPGWWFCSSRDAGVFGCSDQTGICGSHGKKCSPKADRCPRNSSGSSAVEPQRKDGTHLWRSRVRSSQMALSTTRRDQSRGRAGTGKRSQRQSPLRYYQHEAESTVDLRTGVLPTWRHRKSHKRVARPGNRSHQLYQLLGQSVAGSAHGRGLRLNAGVTFASCGYSLCPGPGPQLARAIAQARGSGNGLSTALCYSPARVVPVSACLPSYRMLFGCSERINLPLLAIRDESGRTHRQAVSPLIEIHIWNPLTALDSATGLKQIPPLLQLHIAQTKNRTSLHFS